MKILDFEKTEPAGVSSPGGGRFYVDEAGLHISLDQRPYVVAFPVEGNEWITQAFNFGSPTIVLFGAFGVGDEIVSTIVSITTPFNDPAALLSLGLQSDPGSILPTNGIDAQAVGTYQDARARVTGVDAMQLQVLPGASTAGAGRVTVLVRRA